MFRIPFEDKINNLIRYAYLLSRETDDEQNQVAQIGMFGRKQQSRIILPYGYSIGAPRGSELIVFSVGGITNNTVCFPTYPSNRRKSLKEWEVVIGNQNVVSEMFFDELGNIFTTAPKDFNIFSEEDTNIDCKNLNIQAEENVDINCTDFTLNCDNLNVNATGTITLVAGGTTLTVSSGGISHNGTDIGNTHKHPPGTYNISGNPVVGLSEVPQ